MKRAALASLLGLAVLSALAFASDYAILRFRVAAQRNPFGTVNVSTYYAVQEKNNRTEYIFDHQQDQTCVHSVFGHLGFAPCWYLSRHAEKQITI